VDARELIQRLDERAVVEIDRDELEVLLEVCETARAVDTGLAGWIRILFHDGEIVVQEETPERTVLVRRFDSAEEAEEFVERRLADYDRMWNGCGCKIDYHE
jgi:sporulation-control protein spo0M